MVVRSQPASSALCAIPPCPPRLCVILSLPSSHPVRHSPLQCTENPATVTPVFGTPRLSPSSNPFVCHSLALSLEGYKKHRKYGVAPRPGSRRFLLPVRAVFTPFCHLTPSASPFLSAACAHFPSPRGRGYPCLPSAQFAAALCQPHAFARLPRPRTCLPGLQIAPASRIITGLFWGAARHLLPLLSSSQFTSRGVAWKSPRKSRRPRANLAS
jgi:hypothetical protein